jgi:hypothetical protein
MSTTGVRTSTALRTMARSSVYVATEIVNILGKIVQRMGIAKGCLTQRAEIVLNGLIVWIGARQVDAVVLELLDSRDTMPLKFELKLDYTTLADEEEQYRTNIESLESFLTREPPTGITKYQLFCEMNTKDYIEVPGWIATSSSDDSHLKKHELAGDVVFTKHLRAAISVFTSDNTEPGDAS